MLLIAGAALLSFIVSLVLTPLCRNASYRIGLVDKPDQKRKIHRHPVARVGGVPIFMAIGASVGALTLMRQHLSELNWNDIFPIMPAFAVVFFTGLIDDIRGLKPWQKLALEIIGASLACSVGVQIESLAGHYIGDTWWHVPLTVIWLLGCTNAFNLIDGVDGLAAGVGLFATITTLIAALLGGNPALALATALLGGALLGFLRYNFNPASIFLGDCGSLSIGFVLGCFGVIWSQKTVTAVGMTAPLFALCIPILEAGLSIFRRLLRGKPVFGADRRHIHHRLLDLGFSSRTVVLMMYGAAGIAAGCSLLINFADTRFGGVIILLFCLGAWIAVQHLGYGEFEVARHVIFGGVIPGVINAQVTLKQLDAGLAAAESADERWKVLAATSRKMGFNELDVQLDGRTWSERLGSAPSDKCWHMQIPLDGSGAANFSIAIGATVHPATLASFAEIVWRSLGASHADDEVRPEGLGRLSAVPKSKVRTTLEAVEPAVKNG
jgi:UDP-GlcNAc:undecaprenyl-phosphate GlcNAc-1-phosphate transferase